MTTYAEVDTHHERSLTSQLRDWATHRAATVAPRPSKSIHASSFYKCARSQVYSLLGYEPTDKNYVWSWDLAAKHGDAVHSIAQGEFVESGKAVILANGKPAIELTLGNDCLPPDVAVEFAAYKIGCRVDAVLEAQDGSHVPIEIKTIDSKYINGSSQKFLPEKLADYEAQTQMVLHWYRNHKTGERSQNAVIYLINRGDISQRLEYLVQYNPLFIEPELERVASIRDHWMQAKLPEPEPQRGCSFCQFKTICPAPAHLKK